MRKSYTTITLLVAATLLGAGQTSAQQVLPAPGKVTGELVVAEAADGATHVAVLTTKGFVPVKADTADLAPGQLVVADVTQDRTGPVATRVAAVKGVAAAPKPSGKIRKHTAVVVTAVPKGVPGKAPSMAKAKAAFTRSAKFWRAQGKGVSFTISKTKANLKLKSTCDNPWKLWDEIATKSKFKRGDGKHLVVFFPDKAYAKGCSYGLGTIGGKGLDSGGFTYQSNTGWSTTAHELGHNLSLQHANGFTDKVGEAKKGSTVEYGDYYSVMGYGTGNISARQLYRLGLVGGGNIKKFTSSTTVTLRALDAKVKLGKKTLKTVRVTDPNTNVDYWLEYRPKGGFDHKSPARFTTPGVLIRKDSLRSDGHVSLLIDTSKRSGRSTDAALTRGRTWTSLGKGVKVKVVSAGSKSATVKITVKRAKNIPKMKFTAPKTARYYDEIPLKLTASKKIKGKITFSAVYPGGYTEKIKTVTLKDGKATYTWKPGQKFIAKGPVQRLKATIKPSSGKWKKGTVFREFTLKPQKTKITLTATDASVEVTVKGGVSKPEGRVTYKATSEWGDEKVSSVELSGGRASIPTTSFVAGRWTVKVTYTGDSPFEHRRTLEGSSKTIKLTVQQRDKVRVDLVQTPSSTKGNVVLTATYTAQTTKHTPTGTVQLAWPGSQGGDDVVGQLVGGQAVFDVPAPTGGNSWWVLVYSGDGHFMAETRWVKARTPS